MDMQEEELFMFQEAEGQSGVMQHLANQEELMETTGLLSQEDSIEESSYNCQEALRQLEGLLAQCEEQCEEAAAREEEETQQAENRYAKTVALLHKAIQKTEVLRREIRNFEEEVEEEEACMMQKMKEAETPETALPEMAEEQMEKDLRARRRGFIYWLQMLCVLFVVPELAVLFSLAAAVLYASYCDTEFLYRLLLRMLFEETYNTLAYAVGRILTVVSEELLPF